MTANVPTTKSQFKMAPSRLKRGKVKRNNSPSKGAFDWQIWISDFPMKREIQKRISTNRNPFPRVLSIGKSGFRFRISDFGFPNKTQNPKTDFDEPKSLRGLY